MKVIGVYVLLMCLQRSLCSEEILLDDDIEDRPLSKSCLRCLCEVMGCQAGSFDNTCGVFRITPGYWKTAHYKRNQHDDTQEYQNCCDNLWCAVRTVQRYMRQNLPAAQSRRPDRLLCENAVALHVFGSHRGHHNLTANIHRKLFSCLQKRAFKWLEVKPL